jgi:hypothetical protein
MCSILDRQLLKEHLIQAGLWDQILKDSVLQKKRKVARTMTIQESGDFQGYHTDALALHRMNEHDAREYIDASNGSPDTGAEVPSEKMPPKGNKPSRAARASKASWLSGPV